MPTTLYVVPVTMEAIPAFWAVGSPPKRHSAALEERRNELAGTIHEYRLLASSHPIEPI